MSSSDLLEQAIAEFLLANEEGRPLDRSEWLGRYAVVADELQLFLQDHDRISSALCGPDRSAASSATISLSSQPSDASVEVTIGSRLLASSASSVPTLDGGAMAFGEYELLEEIARGGMGVVYKARQRRLNRIVALKMILSGQLADDAEVQRFYAEAEAAAQLEHTGIVPIHEIGQLEGLHYYTMSFVEGQSLAEMLREGPLAPQHAAQLIRKIAVALAYAHKHRVIHRDLKPANILVDVHGEPRVTDFGLAKRTDSTEALTATGQILGTLQYMPPEQASGRQCDISEAADIYSLGAVLYAALTAKPPFQASRHIDLLLQVLQADPVAPRRIQSQIPRELELICMRCLQKDPKRRYASMTDMAEDLGRYLRGEPLEHGTPSVLERVRRLPRRLPALTAHLGGLIVIESFRQTRLLWAGSNVLQHEWAYHWQFSGIFGLWALICFALNALVQRPRLTELGRFLWAAADVVFVTWVLALAHGPLGLLFPAFSLLIVASGSFFRVRLVIFMTCACILAYITVLCLRPEEAQPLHYAVVGGGVLAVIGLIMGYQVYRLRALYQYYERAG